MSHVHAPSARRRFSDHFEATETKRDYRWSAEPEGGTSETLLRTEADREGIWMVTNQLSTFCLAVYVKRPPLSRQPKFLKALFESAGSTWSYSDDYGRKLACRRKELTQDVCDAFPSTIGPATVAEFLHKHLTNTTGEKSNLKGRYTKVATDAGLPTNLTIELDASTPALGDWFQAAIKNPTYCDILATAYQRRLEGEDNPDIASVAPLCEGDRVFVSNPPSQQFYSAPFGGWFSNEWSLQHTGTMTSPGRSLRYVNPTDNGVRPATNELPVRDTASKGSAKVANNFETRGREGKATSRWQMINSNGNNCFPSRSATFDVSVDIANPSAPRSEVR